MNVVRFHHVSLNANDGSLPDLLAFYQDVFGLDTKPRPDLGIPGHWLAVGDQELHLIGAPAAPADIDPVGPHYCVAVDDLEAAVAELDARGIEHVGTGGGQVWFTDPAGNTIELQQDGPAR
ncbi:MAG: lactoylglutathione lyase family protein [Acidimicrobiales bacterium]|nr:lactoylglutathione lyase family protein [Acidimicrobiales bacterium]